MSAVDQFRSFEGGNLRGGSSRFAAAKAVLLQPPMGPGSPRTWRTSGWREIGTMSISAEPPDFFSETAPSQPLGDDFERSSATLPRPSWNYFAAALASYRPPGLRRQQFRLWLGFRLPSSRKARSHFPWRTARFKPGRRRSSG